MASIDKEKWNKKYSKKQYIEEKPSEILEKFYSVANIGNALDIACGTGRNAIFLANKGFNVDAIDISDVAIKILKEKNPHINTIIADLDEYNLKENKYELIVNVNFLNRNLIPSIKEALKTGGIVIFETFVVSQRRKNKSYYLRPNELLRLFLDFHIIFYEEKDVSKEERKAYLVARKVC
ncbi:MAG: tellurium resistance protein TehB [Hydrogenothermus sp.]|nr:MAG: tellurium resistance protein TehB [Hydrogenothermus sp.]